MKIKHSTTLFVFSTLLAASCATAPKPSIPMDPQRDPASIWSSCFESVSAFFGKSPSVQATETIPVPAKRVISEALALNPTRYPNGFQDRTGMHIQYGFESEYLHHEADVLLKNYMPKKPHYDGSKEEWLALTHEQRANFIESRSRNIFPYRQKGELLKITDDPELDAVLPSSFVFDAGHYEIVLDPMDSAEEMAKKIKVINAKLGVGSMQMTISNPIEKNLLKKSQSLQKQMKEEIIGYYNFMNEFDTLGKLTTGYERFLKSPNSETVKSFNHPWLGPMTKLKHDRMEGILDNVLAGKNYTDEELTKMSSLVVSHKFIGGLSFRPDVAFKKSRLASEVRDCHQNVKCIENRLIRETYFLMKGRSDFSRYSQLIPFDSEKSFESMSKNSRVMLRKIFPAYGNFSQTEMELYRNFSYPLRDWSKHIEILERPELNQTIASAQNDYKRALETIANEFTLNKIDKNEARNRVMGALGEFSQKSGIAEAMKNQFDEHINPDELKLFDHLKLTYFLYYNFQKNFLAA